MAHFYGTVSGKGAQVNRQGTKDRGLKTQAGSYAGAIEVRLWHNTETGKDMFKVMQRQWLDSTGVEETIAEGVIGVPFEEMYRYLPRPTT